MDEAPTLALPPRVVLADPAPFLRAISQTPWFHLNLDDLEVAELWALVGLCALSRKELPDAARCDVIHRGSSSVATFAHAIGFDAAQAGSEASPKKTAQPHRTAPIQRVARGRPIEASARALARMAIPADDEEESRDALTYVVVELLRNVLQHSGDPLGAVVGAQRMDAGKGGYLRPTVQVAVADAGQGILATLQRFHTVDNAEAALEKALRPHVSGVFPEGQMGGADNAGLGLFFTSEMAKLTAGRLLLASRGASLFLDGDEAHGKHRFQFLEPVGTGYPGTLAVFELPLEIVDRDALMDVIRARATERTPSPTSRSWITYVHVPVAPVAPDFFVVHEVAEDATAARAMADQMKFALSASRPITLDFAGIRIATQSFLHALLFHPVRVGWALGAPIYVMNAEPAVRSGIAYLESYALP